MTTIVFNIAIGRSKLLLLYLVLVHGVMIMTLFSLLGVNYMSMMILMVLLFSFVYYCYQHQWLKSEQAIIGLERDEKLQWMCVFKSGKRSQFLQLKSCFVSSALVMLTFRSQQAGRGKTVTLLADATDPELLRQLRVYCRNPKTF
jgi:toxin CptA